MITLTLLHPLQSVPVQTWVFEPQPVLRIGRSRNNEVTLYSAVVSRHHVELRHSQGTNWELVNTGSNGTYVAGKRVARVPVANGMIFRLASSGPQIQIWTEPRDQSARPAVPARRSTGKASADLGANELERAKETKFED